MNETTAKKRAYYKKYVTITEENKANIEISAMWFALDHAQKMLKFAPVKTHGLLKLKHYHVTIQTPIIVYAKKM